MILDLTVIVFCRLVIGMKVSLVPASRDQSVTVDLPKMKNSLDASEIAVVQCQPFKVACYPIRV